MDFEKDITIIKHKLIDRALFATTLYALIPLVSSIYRTIDIGWHPIYLLHVAIVLSIFLLFSLRNKLNLAIKTHSFLIIYLIISLAGIVPFKMISGFYFITVVVTISTIILGIRTGIYYCSFFLLSFCLLAYLHLNNIINSSIDFNEYSRASSTWINQILSILYVLLILLYAINLFYKYFIEAIYTSKQKNNELNLALMRLKSEEQRFSNVVESSNDGYLFINENLTITYVNNSLSKLSGYAKKDIIGKDYKSWLKERYEDWEAYYENLTEAISKQKKILYTDIADKAGNRHPVEINLYKSDEKNNAYIWGVVKDLREIKRLENQIFTTMVQAEEKERERYAKELHDGMGPLISTAMIYINTILEDATDKTVKDFAQRAFDLLKESTLTIKEISNNLSPLILRDYGMAHAVRSFIEKAQNINKIQFKIIDNISKRFSESTEITMYRTLIELINNSLKYAKAQNITITFDCIDNSLLISYTDDGTGFDYPKIIKNKSGYGLMNMESRIKKLGGTYEYATAPGQGVHVTAHLKGESV